MSDDGWDIARKQAKDPQRRQFHFGNTRLPGCEEIHLCVECLPWPVGMVWYRWVGNSTIETLHSYVFERLRRCGIRTALHESLIQSYPQATRFITASGSKDGGEAWLKATGFKKNRRTGDWEFVVKRGKRK